MTMRRSMTMREAIEIGLAASRAAKRTGQSFRFDAQKMESVGFTNDQVRKAQTTVYRIEQLIEDEVSGACGERTQESKDA